MRPKCQFKNNGQPTTLPGTDDDAKRIWLSKTLTAILVFNGDEAQGAYQVPGASGYATWEVKAAKQRLAPQKPKGKKEKKVFGANIPMGERVKPRKEPPPEPQPDQWQILAERFGQLGKQLGSLNKRIKSLAKPD